MNGLEYSKNFFGYKREKIAYERGRDATTAQTTGFDIDMLSFTCVIARSRVWLVSERVRELFITEKRDPKVPFFISFFPSPP